MPAVKPLWVAGPEAIDPDWLWAWDGVEAVLPLGSADPVRGVVPNRVGAISDVVTPYGSGILSGDGVSYIDYGRIDTFPTWTRSSGFVLAKHDGSFDGFPTVLSIKTSGVENDLALIIRDGEIRANFDDGIDSDGATWTGMSSTTAWFAIGWTHDGSNLRLYVDGVLRDTNTFATGKDYASADGTIYLGNNADNPVGYFALEGRYAVAYVWSKTLTAREMAILSDDPFGPIRPASFQPWMATAASLSASLYATGDGTISSVVDETDATTDLYLSIDDDPASPNDADWINNAGGV